MRTITVPCPICQNELEVEVKVINDSDGDGPYIRTFLTLDEYTIKWDSHESGTTRVTANEVVNCAAVYKFYEQVLSAEAWVAFYSSLDGLDQAIADKAVEAASEPDEPDFDPEEHGSYRNFFSDEGYKE